MKQTHIIYIVDDDNDDREILRDAFMSVLPHHQYVLLENGERLLEELGNNSIDHQPALILLDLNMPGKDGRETLKEIKNSKKFFHIPTLIFTTSSSVRDKKQAYESGANCFTSKPDTFEKLVEFANSVNQLWLS